MIEGDVAANLRQVEARSRVFCRRVENVTEARHRDTDLLEILPQLREADDRRGNLSCQHIEGDKLANGELAFNDELGTEIQCGDGYGFLDKLDTLLADGGQLGHAETGVHIAGHLLVPATGHLRLDRHGFNGAQRGHGFDEK